MCVLDDAVAAAIQLTGNSINRYLRTSLYNVLGASRCFSEFSREDYLGQTGNILQFPRYANALQQKDRVHLYVVLLGGEKLHNSTMLSVGQIGLQPRNFLFQRRMEVQYDAARAIDEATTIISASFSSCRQAFWYVVRHP